MNNDIKLHTTNELITLKKLVKEEFALRADQYDETYTFPTENLPRNIDFVTHSN